MKLYEKLKNTREQGFTLIELLVVIVIIGVLAAIALPIFMNQQRAAINASSVSSLRQVTDAIKVAQIKTGKTLFRITNASCTGCAFGTQDPLTDDPSSNAWNAYYRALDRISVASGMDVRNVLDGYGRPIFIDENEGENGNCNKDMIGTYMDPFISRSNVDNTVRLDFVSNECRVS